ncbi:hypothetical protein Forpi1262_v008637 [Fusarium oxysporum f. sp. raphani]|uniref:Uncharacterized protein n=1 Tax=Fusarium oxysporum f. sp. raphani TaxID=96318 RepID=A0A8J5PJ78_FUSOX|nr:hypothetical protein Forpi1262_v008637 [Fusarium oxysporum f. sp. raphani]
MNDRSYSVLTFSTSSVRNISCLKKLSCTDDQANNNRRHAQSSQDYHTAPNSLFCIPSSTYTILFQSNPP